MFLAGPTAPILLPGFDMVLLVASGIITILPLAWYISAAQLMPLVTLGTLFYLAPTLGFLSGVFLYREPFSTGHAVMFSLILSGLAVFTVDAYRHDDESHDPGEDQLPNDPTRYKRL